MALNSREPVSIPALFESLKKVLSFAEHFAVTTLPRGGLQIALKSVTDVALLKSYGAGFDREDRLSWGAILSGTPLHSSAVWPESMRGGTSYWRDFMSPHNLEFSVCFPLRSPLLAGYPGAIHLCRGSSTGEFTEAEITEIGRVITEFETRLSLWRSPRNTSGRARRLAMLGGSTAASLLVLDSSLNPVSHQGTWPGIDTRVREQMIEQAQRRMQQLDGGGVLTDRVQFPDSQGNVLAFRVMTYARYPALGAGPMSFFCPQPTCSDWGHLQAGDFQADEELNRLIPALAFMQVNFRTGPALADIAKAAHLSPFHFHRRFSELLGLTPKQFLLECQMQEAKNELLAGDKELAAIAKDCGFAHQSHFTSRFKQAIGLTPTRWRRMMLDPPRTSET